MTDFSSTRRNRRVTVIGGGITGLAAAHRIGEIDPTTEVVVLEAADRLGGVIETVRQNGYLLELGADSFITNVPWGADFCRRIGLETELIQTSPDRRRTFVVRAGRLEPVPVGFLLVSPGRLWPVLATRVLSPLGKLRLLWEYFVPPSKDQADESLAAFVRRRLGREAYERLVQPLVSGIYTADPELLSLQATLPRFQEMERTHGGLIRAALRRPKKSCSASAQESGARYGLFMAPSAGLSAMVEAVARRLPAGSIRLGHSVEQVSAAPQGGWTVTTALGETLACDAVIAATPAPATARILAHLDPDLAAGLSRIPYAGCAVAVVAYKRAAVAHKLDGFGFVVPAVENRRILAASFSSLKFPGRAPAEHILIRVFVGGATRSELMTLPDEELRGIVTEELRDLIGATGEPLLFRLRRWQGHMPQYHLGHVELVQSIERRVASWPGLELAGNAYHGVGIPQCIRSGEMAAERIVQGITDFKLSADSG